MLPAVINCRWSGFEVLSLCAGPLASCTGDSHFSSYDSSYIRFDICTWKVLSLFSSLSDVFSPKSQCSVVKGEVVGTVR